ncbi:MAG TPA: hypothetical protein VGF99_15300 [Myxococcota bacterium]
MLASFAMDVVQWLIPRRDGASRGALLVCFAPAWADRLPATGGMPALRRRSAPMVSRHLPRAIAVAVDAADLDDDSASSLSDSPGSVAVTIHLAVDGEPILPADADDIRFAAVLGEFVAVVVDLCEAAGLPVMGALPVDERRGLQVLLGGLSGLSRARLGDALLMLAAATQTAAMARGFSAKADLVIVADRRVLPIDALLEGAL